MLSKPSSLSWSPNSQLHFPVVLLTLSAYSPGKISSLVDSSRAAKLTARLYDTLEEKRLGPQFASRRSPDAGGAEPAAAKRAAAPADTAQNGVKKMRWDQPTAPAPAAPAAGDKAPLTPQQVRWWGRRVGSIWALWTELNSYELNLLTNYSLELNSYDFTSRVLTNLPFIRRSRT